MSEVCRCRGTGQRWRVVTAHGGTVYLDTVPCPAGCPATITGSEAVAAMDAMLDEVIRG